MFELQQYIYLFIVNMYIGLPQLKYKNTKIANI